MNSIFVGFLLFANWLTFDGKGKHIVLVGGDEEYRSEEMLPQLGRILSKHHGFKTTVLFAIDPADGTVNPDRTNNIPGLEALKAADLMILMIRWRDLPDDQMKSIIDYVESGKPVIGIRTATHPFNSKTSKTYERWNWNNKDFDGGFGRQVLGETWVAHHGKHKVQSTRARFAPGRRRIRFSAGSATVRSGRRPMSTPSRHHYPATAFRSFSAKCWRGCSRLIKPLPVRRMNPRSRWRGLGLTRAHAFSQLRWAARRIS